jgi:hypothetical protein
VTVASGLRSASWVSGRWHAVRWVGAATLAATAGLALARGLIVPVVVLLAAASLLGLGWRRLTVLLIGATFVTVVRIDVLGASFRIEHLILLSCVAAMILAGRERALLVAARDRTPLLFAAFVLWSAFASVFQAVEPSKSLLIVGWLALDWLFLVVLLAAWEDASTLAGVAARWAAMAAVVAIGLWISATVAGTGFGVVTVDVERGTAATGLSFEPNLLGFTFAVWAFLVLSGAVGISGWKRTALAVLALLALMLSLTRAAIIGLLCGLLVWAMLGGAAARRRTVRVMAATAVAALIVAAVAPGVGAPFARRASRILDFGSGTGQLRVQSWRDAIGDMNGVDWIVGLGSNSFGQRHLDPTQEGVPAYLANLPLQILYDGGIVGVLLLGLTLVSVSSRRRVRDGLGPGLVTVYVVCATATSPFWYGTTWILVALACIDRRQEAANDGSAGGSPLAPVVTPLPSG